MTVRRPKPDSAAAILARELETLGFTIQHTQALELLAKSHGYKHYNAMLADAETRRRRKRRTKARAACPLLRVADKPLTTQVLKEMEARQDIRAIVELEAEHLLGEMDLEAFLDYVSERITGSLCGLGNITYKVIAIENPTDHTVAFEISAEELFWETIDQADEEPGNDADVDPTQSHAEPASSGRDGNALNATTTFAPWPRWKQGFTLTKHSGRARADSQGQPALSYFVDTFRRERTAESAWQLREVLEELRAAEEIEQGVYAQYMTELEPVLTRHRNTEAGRPDPAKPFFGCRLPKRIEYLELVSSDARALDWRARRVVNVTADSILEWLENGMQTDEYDLGDEVLNYEDGERCTSISVQQLLEADLDRHGRFELKNGLEFYLIDEQGQRWSPKDRV